MNATMVSNSNATLKIGLALGSGASRGWCHIGVINALIKQGIQPSVISGTSIGAIIGGAYLSGNLDKLDDWVRSATRTDVLRFFNIKLSQSGFVNTARLEWFLHNYVAESEIHIEDLPVRFGAVATDLNTGREVWFTKGCLASAVKASMAMPGLFPAVGYQQQWLVDGGLVNPVPVSVCRALGADIVIAVNLHSDIVGKHSPRQQEESDHPKTVLNTLSQQVKEYSNSIFPNRESTDVPPGSFYAVASAINIFQDRITRSRMAGDPADVVIAPRLGHIGLLEFHRAAEAIQAGEEYTYKLMDEIQHQIQRVTAQR